VRELQGGGTHESGRVRLIQLVQDLRCPCECSYHVLSMTKLMVAGLSHGVLRTEGVGLRYYVYAGECAVRLLNVMLWCSENTPRYSQRGHIVDAVLILMAVLTQFALSDVHMIDRRTET
jgi:hypothetical protein